MVRETKTEIDPLGYSIDTLTKGATTLKCRFGDYLTKNKSHLFNYF